MMQICNNCGNNDGEKAKLMRKCNNLMSEKPLERNKTKNTAFLHDFELSYVPRLENAAFLQHFLSRPFPPTVLFARWQYSNIMAAK